MFEKLLLIDNDNRSLVCARPSSCAKTNILKWCIFLIVVPPIAPACSTWQSRMPENQCSKATFVQCIHAVWFIRNVVKVCPVWSFYFCSEGGTGEDQRIDTPLNFGIL